MANIQEKISNFLPEATFVEGQILEAVIPAKDWQRVARFLRNDEELQFDYLVSLIGMDWGLSVRKGSVRLLWHPFYQSS